MHAHSNRDIVPRYTSIYNSPTGDMLVICKVYYWQVITSIFFFTIIQIEQVQKHAYLLTKVHVLPFVAARFITTVWLK